MALFSDDGSDSGKLLLLILAPIVLLAAYGAKKVIVADFKRSVADSQGNTWHIELYEYGSYPGASEWKVRYFPPTASDWETWPHTFSADNVEQAYNKAKAAIVP